LVGLVINVITVSVSLSFRTSTPSTRILRQILIPGFAFAYAYFLIAAGLAATMLGHSYEGLVRASGLFLLAIAVGDSVGGRTFRAFLERQLAAVEPHVQYSQLAQGTFHDLRNHVGTAIANLRDIDEGRLDQEDVAAVAVALAALDDARRVLGDAERSGRVTGAAEFTRVDLGELCRHIVALHRRVAAARHLTLGVDTPDAELAVYGHPVLLGEVLTNLILNSIDATPPGGHISLRCASLGSATAVTVTDSGSGVSLEAVARIFEPGFTTKSGRGSGLGLYTALGIARQHHGDLDYDRASTAAGATFMLTLPSFDTGQRTLQTRPDD
jgi:signal transduction histidine kinase